MGNVHNSNTVSDNRLKHSADIRNALDEASIVAVTDNNGILIYVNNKFCEISKYSEDELLGKTHRILKSEYHDDRFYSKLWKTISNGHTWNGDIKNKAKDGSFYWMRTTIIPVIDETQNITKYVSIRTDITSQVELAVKLVKSKQLAAIGELSSKLSHDIRNPLSIISMTMENIRMTRGKNQIRQDQFDKIQRAIFRISHQIDDVLDYVKKQTLTMNRIKISDLISDSLDSVFIPNNITLKLPKNDFDLICDFQKLSSAFVNLILNSIQAIGGTGTVEITAEENNDKIIIQFKDSGKGISKEDIDKIFDPLFTTKQQGTGLGLSSVTSIIDAHRGTISATSPPTVFTITLPKISDKV